MDSEWWIVLAVIVAVIIFVVILLIVIATTRSGKGSPTCTSVLCEGISARFPNASSRIPSVNLRPSSDGGGPSIPHIIPRKGGKVPRPPKQPANPVSDGPTIPKVPGIPQISPGIPSMSVPSLPVNPNVPVVPSIPVRDSASVSSMDEDLFQPRNVNRNIYSNSQSSFRQGGRNGVGANDMGNDDLFNPNNQNVNIYSLPKSNTPAATSGAVAGDLFDARPGNVNINSLPNNRSDASQLLGDSLFDSRSENVNIGSLSARRSNGVGNELGGNGVGPNAMFDDLFAAKPLAGNQSYSIFFPEENDGYVPPSVLSEIVDQTIGVRNLNGMSGLAREIPDLPFNATSGNNGNNGNNVLLDDRPTGVGMLPDIDDGNLTRGMDNVVQIRSIDNVLLETDLLETQQLETQLTNDVQSFVNPPKSIGEGPWINRGISNTPISSVGDPFIFGSIPEETSMSDDQKLEEKKLVDIVSFSEYVVKLYTDGSITYSKEVDSIDADDDRRVNNNVELERLVVFAGDLYGLGQSNIYKLTVYDFEDPTVTEWVWTLANIKDNITGENISKDVIHISATLDGKYLWMQNNTTSYLLKLRDDDQDGTSSGDGSDDSNSSDINGSNTSVPISPDHEEIRIVEAYTRPRDIRRIYGKDESHYIEHDVKRLTVVTYPNLSKRSGIIAAAMDQNDKLYVVSDKERDTFKDVRIVRWQPYTIPV